MLPLVAVAPPRAAAAAAAEEGTKSEGDSRCDGCWWNGKSERESA